MRPRPVPLRAERAPLPEMTMAEVALALGCEMSTAYERVADERLGIPHYRRGRRVIVLRNEFDRWLTGQREGETTPDLAAQLEEAVYRGVTRALAELALVRRTEGG